MNILFLIPGFPDDEKDYKLSFLWLEVKYLLDIKDINIVVCSNNDSNIKRSNLTIKKLKQTNNTILLVITFLKFLFTIKTVQLNYWKELYYNPRNLLRNVFIEMQIRKIIEQNKIDIIHNHFAYPSGYCGNLANHNNIPLIMNLRGIDIDKVDEFTYGYRQNKNYERRLIVSIKNASKVILQNKNFYDKVLELVSLIDKNKLLIIPNGVELNQKYLVNKTNANQKILNILFVGSLLKRKGVDYLVLSAEELKSRNINFIYQIIGEGEDEKYFKDFVKEKGLQKHFILYGKVEKNMISEFFNNCDILVLPTLADSFPNVIIEAMMHKKPVIAFKTGGVPDMIEDGKTGFLIEQKDYKAMADKLYYFYSNPSEKITMGEFGYQKVIKEFDINLKVERYYNLYQSLLNGKN